MKKFFKSRKNPYSGSEYLWTDRDMFVAALYGAVIGAFFALVVYFQWFHETVVPVFRPLIG